MTYGFQTLLTVTRGNDENGVNDGALYVALLRKNEYDARKQKRASCEQRSKKPACAVEPFPSSWRETPRLHFLLFATIERVYARATRTNAESTSTPRSRSWLDGLHFNGVCLCTFSLCAQAVQQEEGADRYETLHHVQPGKFFGHEAFLYSDRKQPPGVKKGVRALVDSSMYLLSEGSILDLVRNATRESQSRFHVGVAWDRLISEKKYSMMFPPPHPKTCELLSLIHRHARQNTTRRVLAFMDTRPSPNRDPPVRPTRIN